VFGREAVEKQLAVTNPDYRFFLTVTHLRFVTPDVAIADADVRTSIGVYVMVKQDGNWLISGARIARTSLPPAPSR
jgi:hypothetical protein